MTDRHSTAHPRETIQEPAPGPFDFFMTAVALLALALVVAESTLDEASEVAKLFRSFDYAVCAIFFVDFLVRLVRAPRKLRYLFGWGLLDLAASIPFVAGARFVRVVRVFRVIRAIKSIRLLSLAVTRNYRAAALAMVMLAMVFGVVVCSVGVLQYESAAPHGNIKTADDVIWWAAVTASTVGYGDLYPVTPEGRLLAVVLMVISIGAFTSIAGLFASVLTSGANAASHKFDREMREQLRELHSKVSRMAEAPRPPAEASDSAE